MKTIISISIVLLLILGSVFFLSGMNRKSSDIPDPPLSDIENTDDTETAVLAGGCFWGVEAVYENLEGVLDVVSGYSGGSKETALYEIVSSGRTDHAESVLITYNPSLINYGILLKVFFTVAHDPTQLNYQGPDHGRQYRSVIFYTTDEQKRIAEEYIAILEKQNVFSEPIVTEVFPLTAFFRAEKYHQDFLKRNPTHPYIVHWDIPKIEHLKKAFPDLITKE